MLKALIYNNKVSEDRISKQRITAMLNCCKTREHTEVKSPAQPFALETSGGARQDDRQLGEKSSQAHAAWKLESLCFCVLAHRARGQCLTAGSVGSFFCLYVHQLKCKTGTGRFSERLNNLLILRTEGSSFRGCMLVLF